MEIIKTIIQILAVISGCFTAIMSIVLFLRLRWPAQLLWMLKLFVSALSPLFFLAGVLITITGFATGSAFAGLIGIYTVSIFFLYIYRITLPPDSSSGFEKAYGLHWEDTISHEQKNHFLPRRSILKLPTVEDSRFEENISFSTIPGTGRKLLCDIWQPPASVTPSGLAFIYLHGSAWYLLDKDCGTRPLFRHLAAQGHVIMDVAYRLAPETDMMGMIHDVKRAVGWMKENAAFYGVSPNRVVLCGGSAGGHLALLAAYTASNPRFTPKELEGKDFGVCAVISLYGISDLEALYYHTNQHLTTRSTPGKLRKKVVPVKIPAWVIKKMGKDYYRLGFDKDFGNAGALAPLLGGHPDECPETYAFLSPVTHVHPHCPPTLLIHGEHDVMAPIKATRFLYRRLVEEKVHTVMHILPQTDHAFDLILPKISPAAHVTIYDIERFLALQLKISERHEVMTQDAKEHQLSPYQ